jgi:hypothetical protein
MGPAVRAMFSVPPPGPAAVSSDPASTPPPVTVGIPPSPAAAPFPSAPLPPGEPSPVRLSIAAVLEAAREAMPTSAIAQRTNAPADAVARELGGMVKAKIVATGRSPGVAEDLYWIVGAGFQPSVGLTRELFTVPMRLAQVDAVRQASSLAERERFSRTESVDSARLQQLPLWKVTCRRTTKAIFSSPKEFVEDYFVSARTGAFMSIQGREMRFDKVARQGADKILALNDEPAVRYQPTLPRDAGPIPPIKVGLPQACEILRRTFGVEPTEGRLTLLPVWELTLKRKRGNGSRTVALDGAAGKIVVGEY